MVDKLINWTPKQGVYQCVLPAGQVHIDLYVDGRTPQAVSLSNGEEVELFAREIRTLKRSEILREGYLAPLTFFEEGEDGKVKEVEATEDPDNANVISDNHIYVKVQGFKSADDLSEHLQRITSILTANRFRQACVTLDTPQSYLTTVDNRIEELNKVSEDQMYAGPVDDKRKDFLTEKVKKRD